MSVPPRDLPVLVRVSTHARERARERYPGFKAARIVDEVRCALRAGRISRMKPQGVTGRENSDTLYAWTENEERTYAVCAKDDYFLVTTTYGKADADAQHVHPEAV